jgi:ankyrin repeat protein
MVRWLIGKGLDVNAVNRDQQTPICLAAASGPVENLRILIEHGAKANHARIDGRTPFLIAAACGREEVCQFLLFNGHATLNELGTLFLFYYLLFIIYYLLFIIINN